MSRHQIQELEDRASQHYLRGEYHEAFRAWQEVLTLEPGNEQASEGARLSELLLAGTDGMSHDGTHEGQGEPGTGPADPAFAFEGSPAAVATLGDETLLLDPDLLATIVHAPAGGPLANVKAPPTQQIDPDRQLHGFDFGNLDELDAIPLFGESAPMFGPAHAEAATRPDGSPADERSAPAALPKVDPGTEAQAMHELNRRVQDLLAEARTMYSEGRNADALGVLSRIAILDEENGAAQELEADVRSAQEQAALQVDNWIAEGVQAFDQGEMEEARSLFGRVLAVAPEHREAIHYLAVMPAKGSSALAKESAAASARAHADELLPDMAKRGNHEAFGAEFLGGLGPDASEAVPLARPVDAVVPKPESPSVSRLRAPASPPERIAKRGPSKAVWLGGALGVVAVAGVLGWWIFGRGGASSEAANSPAAQTPRRPSAAARPGAPDARSGRPASPAPGAERPLPEVLAHAKGAMGSQEYGAAVIAYNEVLRRDSGNLEAKAGLIRAGEAYKAKNLELEQIEKVRLAFRDQEFTSALHILYRLPTSVDKDRVDSYKIAGWYNLGIVALRGGECAQARSHFDEALAIRAGDEDSRRLRTLADRYLDAEKDRAYYDQVERLSFRNGEN